MSLMWFDIKGIQKNPWEQPEQETKKSWCCTDRLDKHDCEECKCEQPTEDERREIQDVMTARKWIEFGKMWNAMEAEGWELDLITTVDYNGNKMYEVDIWEDGSDNFIDGGFDGRFSTPYAAIKDVYFRTYLGIKKFEDVALDIDPEVMRRVENYTDKNGITVDEFIIEALKEAITEYKY